MEELKAILTMVAHLPTVALWVLAGYLVYQLAVVGSIYGVIRYVAGELFGWLKTHKTAYREVRPMLDGMVITGNIDQLMHQLSRLTGKGVSIDTPYMHKQSVEWLREAIDAKEALDAEKKKARA